MDPVVPSERKCLRGIIYYKKGGFFVPSQTVFGSIGIDITININMDKQF